MKLIDAFRARYPDDTRTDDEVLRAYAATYPREQLADFDEFSAGSPDLTGEPSPEDQGLTPEQRIELSRQLALADASVPREAWNAVKRGTVMAGAQMLSTAAAGAEAIGDTALRDKALSGYNRMAEIAAGMPAPVVPTWGEAKTAKEKALWATNIAAESGPMMAGGIAAGAVGGLAATGLANKAGIPTTGPVGKLVPFVGGALATFLYNLTQTQDFADLVARGVPPDEALKAQAVTAVVPAAAMSAFHVKQGAQLLKSFGSKMAEEAVKGAGAEVERNLVRKLAGQALSQTAFAGGAVVSQNVMRLIGDGYATGNIPTDEQIWGAVVDSIPTSVLFGAIGLGAEVGLGAAGKALQPKQPAPAPGAETAGVAPELYGRPSKPAELVAPPQPGESPIGNAAGAAITKPNERMIAAAANRMARGKLTDADKIMIAGLSPDETAKFNSFVDILGPGKAPEVKEVTPDAIRVGETVRVSQEPTAAPVQAVAGEVRSTAQGTGAVGGNGPQAAPGAPGAVTQPTAPVAAPKVIVDAPKAMEQTGPQLGINWVPKAGGGPGGFITVDVPPVRVLSRGRVEFSPESKAAQVLAKEFPGSFYKPAERQWWFPPEAIDKVKAVFANHTKPQQGVEALVRASTTAPTPQPEAKTPGVKPAEPIPAPTDTTAKRKPGRIASSKMGKWAERVASEPDTTLKSDPLMIGTSLKRTTALLIKGAGIMEEMITEGVHGIKEWIYRVLKTELHDMFVGRYHEMMARVEELAKSKEWRDLHDTADMIARVGGFKEGEGLSSAVFRGALGIASQRIARGENPEFAIRTAALTAGQMSGIKPSAIERAIMSALGWKKNLKPEDLSPDRLKMLADKASAKAFIEAAQSDLHNAEMLERLGLTTEELQKVGREGGKAAVIETYRAKPPTPPGPAPEAPPKKVWAKLTKKQRAEYKQAQGDYNEAAHRHNQEVQKYERDLKEYNRRLAVAEALEKKAEMQGDPTALVGDRLAAAQTKLKSLLETEDSRGRELSPEIKKRMEEMESLSRHLTAGREAVAGYPNLYKFWDKNQWHFVEGITSDKVLTPQELEARMNAIALKQAKAHGLTPKAIAGIETAHKLAAEYMAMDDKALRALAKKHGLDTHYSPKEIIDKLSELLARSIRKMTDAEILDKAESIAGVPISADQNRDYAARFILNHQRALLAASSVEQLRETCAAAGIEFEFDHNMLAKQLAALTWPKRELLERLNAMSHEEFAEMYALQGHKILPEGRRNSTTRADVTKDLVEFTPEPPGAYLAGMISLNWRDPEAVIGFLEQERTGSESGSSIKKELEKVASAINEGESVPDITLHNLGARAATKVMEHAGAVAEKADAITEMAKSNAPITPDDIDTNWTGYSDRKIPPIQRFLNDFIDVHQDGTLVSSDIYTIADHPNQKTHKGEKVLVGVKYETGEEPAYRFLLKGQKYKGIADKNGNLLYTERTIPLGDGVTAIFYDSEGKPTELPKSTSDKIQNIADKMVDGSGLDPAASAEARNKGASQKVVSFAIPGEDRNGGVAICLVKSQNGDGSVCFKEAERGKRFARLDKVADKMIPLYAMKLRFPRYTYARELTDDFSRGEYERLVSGVEERAKENDPTHGDAMVYDFNPTDQDAAEHARIVSEDNIEISNEKRVSDADAKAVLDWMREKDDVARRTAEGGAEGAMQSVVTYWRSSRAEVGQELGPTFFTHLGHELLAGREQPEHVGVKRIAGIAKEKGTSRFIEAYPPDWTLELRATIAERLLADGVLRKPERGLTKEQYAEYAKETSRKAGDEIARRLRAIDEQTANLTGKQREEAILMAFKDNLWPKPELRGSDHPGVRTDTGVTWASGEVHPVGKASESQGAGTGEAVRGVAESPGTAGEQQPASRTLDELFGGLDAAFKNYTETHGEDAGKQYASMAAKYTDAPGAVNVKFQNAFNSLAGHGLDIATFQGDLPEAWTEGNKNVRALTVPARRFIAIAVNDLACPTPGEFVNLLHEGVHQIFPDLDPGTIGALHRAVDSVSNERLGISEGEPVLPSRIPASLRQSERAGERLCQAVAEKMAKEGYDPLQSLGYAEKLWQWLRQVYNGTVIAIQKALGLTPSPDRAVQYLQDRVESWLSGQHDAPDIYGRLLVKQPEFMVASKFKPCESRYSQGIVDPSTGSWLWPQCTPDSLDAMAHNWSNVVAGQEGPRFASVPYRYDTAPVAKNNENSKRMAETDFAAHASMAELLDAMSSKSGMSPADILTFTGAPNPVEFTQAALLKHSISDPEFRPNPNQRIETLPDDLSRMAAKKAEKLGRDLLDTLYKQRERAQDNTDRIPLRLAKAKEKLFNLTTRYTDATTVSSEMQDRALAMVKEFKDNIAIMAANGEAKGALAEEILSIDNRLSRPMLESYANLLESAWKRLATTDSNIYSIIDDLTEVVDRQVLNNMSAVQLRQYVQQLAQGRDSSVFGPLAEETPRGTALRAMVAAFLRTNRDIVDMLELHKMRDIEERIAINQLMKDALKGTSDDFLEAKRAIKKALKNEQLAGRIWTQLRQAKKRASVLESTVNHSQNILDMTDATIPVVDQHLARINDRLGVNLGSVDLHKGESMLDPQSPTATDSEVQRGMTMEYDPNADHVPYVTRWNEWLEDHPTKRGPVYQRVADQVAAVANKVTGDRDVIGKEGALVYLLGSITDRLDMTGNAILREAARKIREYNSIIQGEATPQLQQSAKAGAAMHDLVASLGKKYDWAAVDGMVQRVYSFLHGAFPSMSAKTFDQGMVDVRKYLLRTPELTVLANGKPWDMLKRFIAANGTSNSFFDKLCTNLNLGVLDDLVGGGGAMRARIGQPWATVPATASRMAQGLVTRMSDKWGLSVKDSPLKFANVMERITKDPKAAEQWLRQMFDGLYADWVKPLMYDASLEGRVVIADAPGKGFKIQPQHAIEAYQAAPNDIIAMANKLYDLSVAANPEIPADRAAFTADLMDSFHNAWVMLREAVGARSRHDAMWENPPSNPHVMIDARVADALPSMLTRHMIYDSRAGHFTAHQIAFHKAFGRDASVIKTLFAQGTAQIRSQAAYYESVLEKTAGNRKKAAEIIKADPASPRGPDGKPIAPELLESSFAQRARAADMWNDFKNVMNAKSGLAVEAPALLDVTRAISSSMVQGPKTSLNNLWSLIAPWIRLGVSPMSTKMVADVWTRTFRNMLGSGLDAVGIQTGNADARATKRAACGYAGDTGLSWVEKAKDRHASLANEKQTFLAGEGPGRIYARAFARYSSAAEWFRAKPGIKPGESPYAEFSIAPLPLPRLMNWSGKNMHFGMIEAVISKAEQMLYDRQLFAEGYVKDGRPIEWSKFRDGIKGSDKQSVERMESILQGVGIRLEQLAEVRAKEKMNGNLPIDPFNRAQYQAIASTAQNEFLLETNLINRPPGFLSNPLLMLAMPLWSWQFGQTALVNKAFRGPNMEPALQRFNGSWYANGNVMRAGLVSMAAMLPITIGWAILGDFYDEKLMGKRTSRKSIRDAQDAGQFLAAALENAGQLGTYGNYIDIPSAMFNFARSGDPKGVSLDGRIMLARSIQQALNASSAFINQGGFSGATFATVWRPFATALGGGGYLQYVDGLNQTLVSIGAEDLALNTPLLKQELSLVRRQSSENYLRAAFRSMGIETTGPAGAYGIPNKSRPYVSDMVYAALRDDNSGFWDAYNGAVAAAREEGKEDPVGYVKSAFENRNPIRVAAKVSPTKGEMQTALGLMPVDGREDVDFALRMHDKYGMLVGATPYRGRTDASGLPKAQVPDAIRLLDLQRKARAALLQHRAW